ncbi:MAG TPA: hypothetical protein VLC09_21515, partial [Polyangiaceae bacterium]|nr:hypothetical protein [Polyangiaceae bacterium]
MKNRTSYRSLGRWLASLPILFATSACVGTAPEGEFESTTSELTVKTGTVTTFVGVQSGKCLGVKG